MIGQSTGRKKLCKTFRYMEFKRNKWEEVVEVFKEGKFELLALTKTKFKANGEVS